MPPHIGRELLSRHHTLGRADGLELRVRHLDEGDQLLHDGADVVAVEEGEAELHGAPLDGDVRVLEALDDGAAVALDGPDVGLHRLQQGVQGHVADVLVGVQQEPAQDVHRQNLTGAGEGGGLALVSGSETVELKLIH